MRNVVQFKDKADNLYAVKDIVARNMKADAASLFNYKTASRNIVIVDDAEAESAKRMRIVIDPVQDLHGYDSPWPAGGGKNKFPITAVTQTINGTTFTVASDGAITVSGTPSEQTRIALNSLSITPSADMKFSMTGSATGVRAFVKAINSGSTTYPTISPSSTLGAGVLYESFALEVNTTFTGTVTVKFQLEEGTTVTDWTPYSNLCPISGWTGCNVSRTGVNVWDEAWEQGYYDISTGEKKTATNQIRSKNPIPVKPGTSYYAKIPHSFNEVSRIIFLDLSKTVIGNYSSGYYTTTSTGFSFSVPSNCYFILFNAGAAYGNNSGAYSHDISINYPATDTQYHAYSGSIAEYEFPQAAKPVYGGKLTIHQDGSGELVVDHKVKTLIGNENLLLENSDSFFTDVVEDAKKQQLVRCSVFKSYSASYVSGIENIWISNSGRINLTFPEISHEANALSTFLANLNTAGTPVQLVYELATPITYQLTNQQVIALLKGQNNLWSNTGSIEIDYPVSKMISKADADERYAGMIYEETESAPIAALTDGAEGVPLKNLEVAIEPVQDLHGYDSPWPAGGGKNFCPPIQNATFQQVTTSTDSMGKTTVTGTATGGGGRLNLCSVPFTLPAGSYTIAHNGTGTWGYTLSLSEDGGSQLYECRSTNTYSTFTLSESKTVVVGITIESGVQYNGTVSPQIEVGSTKTSYAPYSNLCPISGWTGANVTRTGVNVWDEEWESGSISPTTGANANDNTRIRAKNYISVLPSTAYYYKSNKDLALRYYGLDKTFIGTGSAKNNAVTTPANCYFMRFAVVDTTEYANDISINYPSTDTQYHAYSGSTAEYSFPQYAKPVYGGSLTIHQDGTGALVVDRAKVVLDGSQSTSDYMSVGWQAKSNTTGIIFKTVVVPNIKTFNGQVLSAIKCDRFPPKKYMDLFETDVIGVSPYTETSSNYGLFVRINDTTVTSVQLANAYFESNPTTVVYELATPVTYTLSEQDVLALLKGNNNLFADCGNILEVEYPVDTKLYIAKELTASRKLMELIVTANRENGMTATKAYSAGNLLIVGGTLYKATTSIANGAAFTVGTNVTETTVAAEIAALA